MICGYITIIHVFSFIKISEEFNKKTYIYRSQDERFIYALKGNLYVLWNNIYR